MKYKIISSKNNIEKDKHPDMYIIDTKCEEKEARRIIETLKSKKYQGKIAVIGGDNKFNRRALETLKINYLISPEREIPDSRKINITKKDTLKQRDSGLNHVLAKIAKDNDIDIVIDMNYIKNIKDNKQKAKTIARIIQNIKICRRAGCKIKLWELTKNKLIPQDKKHKKAIEAFGFSLGMSTQQVADSLKS